MMVVEERVTAATDHGVTRNNPSIFKLRLAARRSQDCTAVLFIRCVFAADLEINSMIDLRFWLESIAAEPIIFSA